MTDDLVKRLREYRIGCGIHCSAYDSREPLDECIEAADCIEKMERYQSLHAQCDGVSLEIEAKLVKKLGASHNRIETLEAALREITWIATPDHEEARNKATEIARKALEGKDD